MNSVNNQVEVVIKNILGGDVYLEYFSEVW